MIADLLVKQEIMKILAETYDRRLTDIQYLYDQIEYYLCEVRRLLLHPISRGTSGELKFTKVAREWITNKRGEMLKEYRKKAEQINETI